MHEGKAQRAALERLASETSENAAAARLTVEELHAQRIAADPLRLIVTATESPEGARFGVECPKGTPDEEGQ